MLSAYTWCPRFLDADRCLQSDVMTNSRLQVEEWDVIDQTMGQAMDSTTGSTVNPTAVDDLMKQMADDMGMEVGHTGGHTDPGVGVSGVVICSPHLFSPRWTRATHGGGVGVGGMLVWGLGRSPWWLRLPGVDAVETGVTMGVSKVFAGTWLRMGAHSTARSNMALTSGQGVAWVSESGGLLAPPCFPLRMQFLFL